FLTATPQRRHAAMALATVTVLVGLMLLAGLIWRDRQAANRDRATAAGSVAEQKSIAVLPFESLNNRPDDTYFVNGVQDHILTDLAKVSELKVISRTGVERYRDQRKDTRVIG